MNWRKLLAGGYGWNFHQPVTAPPQTHSGVWASIGINAVVSGSIRAARLRLTLRTPADPRTKYGNYFAGDIKPA
jgi:hypothetical protein